MNTIHRRTHKRLRLLALSICCLLAAYPAARTSTGQVTIKVDLDTVDAAFLSAHGPAFASPLDPFHIHARVFVLRAPMAVEYQLGKESTATLKLRVKLKEDDKEAKEFLFPLKPTGDKITVVKFRLPEWFGDKPLVASLFVDAMNIDQNNKQPPDYALYGASMGDKAVGSMALEHVKFNTLRINTARRETVEYSFDSRSNFEYASATFRLLGVNSKGEPQSTSVYDATIDGLRKGQPALTAKWGGKNRQGSVSKGPHELLVEAWNGEVKGADWTSEWSTKRVQVE